MPYRNRTTIENTSFGTDMRNSLEISHRARGAVRSLVCLYIYVGSVYMSMQIVRVRERAVCAREGARAREKESHDESERERACESSRVCVSTKTVYVHTHTHTIYTQGGARGSARRPPPLPPPPHHHQTTDVPDSPDHIEDVVGAGEEGMGAWGGGGVGKRLKTKRGGKGAYLCRCLCISNVAGRVCV